MIPKMDDNDGCVVAVDDCDGFGLFVLCLCVVVWMYCIRFNFHILFEFHILSDLAVILWMGWIHMVSQEQIVWMRSEMDGSSENEWCADDNPFGGVFHMMTVHVFLV
eukprot:847396_1